MISTQLATFMKFTSTGGRRWLGLGVVVLSLGACQSLNTDENECTASVLAPVSRLSSVKTGKVGEPLEVFFTVPIQNGCGQFQKLDEARTGFNLYLSPQVRYEGCVCAEVVTDYNGIYRFTATQPGTYVVHFLTTNNRELTDTLTVQP